MWGALLAVCMAAWPYQLTTVTAGGDILASHGVRSGKAGPPARQDRQEGRGQITALLAESGPTTPVEWQVNGSSQSARLPSATDRHGTVSCTKITHVVGGDPGRAGRFAGGDG